MRMKYFHVLSIMKEILLLLDQRIIRAGYGKMVQQQRPQLQQQNENYIFIIVFIFKYIDIYFTSL
jgi:hypothetical protein